MTTLAEVKLDCFKRHMIIVEKIVYSANLNKNVVQVEITKHDTDSLEWHHYTEVEFEDFKSTRLIAMVQRGAQIIEQRIMERHAADISNCDHNIVVGQGARNICIKCMADNLGFGISVPLTGLLN